MDHATSAPTILPLGPIPPARAPRKRSGVDADGPSLQINGRQTRQRLSHARVISAVAGNEPNDGRLLRKRVQPKTAKLYEVFLDVFYRRYHLSRRSAPETIDYYADNDMLRLYLLGMACHTSSHLLYATRRSHIIEARDLPLTHTCLLRYRPVQKMGLQEFINWEEIQFQCLARVTARPAGASEQEAVMASVGMIAAFYVYGRSSDAANAIPSELRAPFACQRGPLRHSTLTLHPSTGNHPKASKTNQHTRP